MASRRRAATFWSESHGHHPSRFGRPSGASPALTQRKNGRGNARIALLIRGSRSAAPVLPRRPRARGNDRRPAGGGIHRRRSSSSGDVLSRRAEQHQAVAIPVDGGHRGRRRAGSGRPILRMHGRAVPRPRSLRNGARRPSSRGTSSGLRRGTLTAETALAAGRHSGGHVPIVVESEGPRVEPPQLRRRASARARADQRGMLDGRSGRVRVPTACAERRIWPRGSTVWPISDNQ
jgi:hypothetical protein